MLVEAFFSTLVSFCLVQLLHNTASFIYSTTKQASIRDIVKLGIALDMS